MIFWSAEKTQREFALRLRFAVVSSMAKWLNGPASQPVSNRSRVSEFEPYDCSVCSCSVSFDTKLNDDDDDDDDDDLATIAKTQHNTCYSILNPNVSIGPTT